MTFFRGQKVVCVDDGDQPSPFPKDVWGKPVTAGVVYTIRGFGRPCHIRGVPTVYLCEVHRPSKSYTDRLRYGDEIPLAAWRFRPVTDISDLIEIVSEVRHHNPRDLSKIDPLDKRRVRV